MTLFAEIGPYGVDSNYDFSKPNLSNLTLTLVPREVSWNNNYHLLTIDSPVNTGYSYSLNNSFATTTDQASAQLINFLSQFYDLYPNLVSNPLYLAGRSYGGHWASNLAYLIAKNQYYVGNKKVSLKGTLYLDGLMDLSTQQRWADLYYASGSTEQYHRDAIRAAELKNRMECWEGNYKTASYGFTDLGSYIMHQATPGLIVNNIRQFGYNGGGSSFEAVSADQGASLFLSLNWTNITTARTVFKVPTNLTFYSSFSTTVYSFFDSGDLAKNFTYAIEYLLNQELKVGFTGGQDDGNLGYYGLIEYVNELSWPHIKSFRKSEKQFLYAPNNTIIGNYKSYKNLKLYSVCKAGHLGTLDQPVSMFTILTQFVNSV